MKKKRILGNSLLLATSLVASLNLGISSGNAAMIVGSGIEASTEETIYRRNGFGISAEEYRSDRHIFLMKDLLNSTGDDITPLTPVNNFQSEGANSYEINSIESSEVSLNIFLMLFHSLENSDPSKNQFSIASDTDRVEPTEINPSPVSVDPVVKAPSPNNTAKAPKNTSTKSSEPLTSKARLKLAQLPKDVSSDKEVKLPFDPVQIIGGALALGFLFWMLLQD
jgi:hypothetical protein